MRWLPRLHDVYIGRVVLVTVLLTWAVLVGLDMLMALSGEVGDLGQGNYTFGHAVAYIAYTVPRRAYVLFPTAAVIGALMGLGQLAATSELTALRALGLSRRRLSLSVAITLAAMTVLMIANMETLAPWGQRQADALRTQAKSRDLAVQYSGLWAREGNTFLNAQHGDEQAEDGRRRLQLRDVSLYELGEDGRLVSIAHAGTAEHVDGSWVLTDVRRTIFHANSATRQVLPGERWESQLDPAALAASFARPRYQSARDLGSNIEYRERNQLDAREYKEVYWGRWFYPLNVLALCLAAMPFAFGTTLRSGSLGKRLFLGILFALGFWLLQLLFGRLAGALKFDYRVAYALPPMVMMAVSWWLFRRKSG